jgi:hypothetical protein
LDLAKAIRRVIEKKDLTHAGASVKTGVGRTAITAIMIDGVDHVFTNSNFLRLHRLLDAAGEPELHLIHR